MRDDAASPPPVASDEIDATVVIDKSDAPLAAAVIRRAVIPRRAVGRTIDPTAAKRRPCGLSYRILLIIGSALLLLVIVSVAALLGALLSEQDSQAATAHDAATAGTSASTTAPPAPSAINCVGLAMFASFLLVAE